MTSLTAYSCAKCGSLASYPGKCCGRSMEPYGAVNAAALKAQAAASNKREGR